MEAHAVDVAETTPVRILVVDDTPENRVALRAMLESPDYEIVEAASGPEALLRLLEGEFALLLVDIVMPQMSGFELATAVKQRTRTATVPILFLTAEVTDIEQIYRAYRIGAVDYLTMPLNPEMVRAKVAVFADLYRQRQRIERQAERLVEAERKESELRLLELRMASERHYRNLSNAIPHIVWTARPDGTVDFFNQRWFEYTGISAADAQGSWLAAVHPEDAAQSRQKWEEALRTGETYEGQCRLRLRGDSEYRWQLARAVPEHGAGGAVISWLGTFTDIEEQRRAHAVLAQLKDTLDAVLDCVLIFDPVDWRVLYANQGASMLLGHPHDELLRLRPVDFIADMDECALRETLAPLRTKRSKLTIETRFRRRDGRRIPVEVSLHYVGIGDCRVVAIAHDITDRKRSELERELLYREAVNAVSSRDDFISVASHELRTPLGSMSLAVEYVRRWASSEQSRTAPPDAVRTKIEVAARQVDRLTQLVAQLMDVSRIRAGRLELQREGVDLVEVARDVLQRFADEATKARCELSIRADGPMVGQWDRLRIEQVATNLLSNALKFGAGKPVEVNVGGDADSAWLSVRDHGIGVAPEDVERIFARFERTTSARGYGGMGLGLYIVRQIVKEHGGHIRVESEPGAGSTFTVELPRRPPATTTDAEGDAAKSAARDS